MGGNRQAEELAQHHADSRGGGEEGREGDWEEAGKTRLFLFNRISVFKLFARPPAGRE